ncbi:hypothetical protein Hs30E_08400 [Lactococcus hodotermopsidis]|uniref:Abortive infection protein-like C-terminal domain-containing protein n=1 Tax=Pseudolactococcus hodotermopsidis TaxID=2709157 RepID=A0A6A0BA48_9LACT|nr:hypothetical protein [Lactococcus hodotermopsidis]GFH42289.1 hypothetical protein Hs30E_08400 [Lactococcus hodotermopsidis]
MTKLSNVALNTVTDALLSCFPNFRDIDLIKHMSLFALENDFDLKHTRTKADVPIRTFIFDNLAEMDGKNQKLYLLETSKIIETTLGKYDSITFSEIIKRAIKTINSESERKVRKEVDRTLDIYPEVKSEWLKVYDKVNSGENRYALDSARLSLELLLKTIFNNEKSLENQQKNIGEALKQKSVSKEFITIITQNLRQYAELQNENAKHKAKSDDWEELEVETILNQTWLLMKYLITKLGRRE